MKNKVNRYLLTGFFGVTLLAAGCSARGDVDVNSRGDSGRDRSQSSTDNESNSRTRSSSGSVSGSGSASGGGSVNGTGSVSGSRSGTGY